MKKVDTELMKAVYSLGLQGDVKSVIKKFKTVPETSLTTEEKSLKEKYIKRFVENQRETVEVNDQFVKKVIMAYRSYWDKALMGKINKSEGFKYLFSSLKKIMNTEFKSNFGSFGEIEARKLAIAVEEKLKERGYHGIFGMTRPHLELMLWKKQEEKVYNISLHDIKQKVDVVFDLPGLTESKLCVSLGSLIGGKKKWQEDAIPQKRLFNIYAQLRLSKARALSLKMLLKRSA